MYLVCERRRAASNQRALAVKLVVQHLAFEQQAVGHLHAGAVGEVVFEIPVDVNDLVALMLPPRIRVL